MQDGYALGRRGSKNATRRRATRATTATEKQLKQLFLVFRMALSFFQPLFSFHEDKNEMSTSARRKLEESIGGKDTKNILDSRPTGRSVDIGGAGLCETKP